MPEAKKATTDTRCRPRVRQRQKIVGFGLTKRRAAASERFGLDRKRVPQ